MRKMTELLVLLLLSACSAGDHTGRSGDHATHQAPLPEAMNFSPDQVFSWISDIGTDARVAVIDVRDPKEFAEGHMTGARNIAMDDLPDRTQDLQGYDHIVMVCNRGGRSSRAAVACVQAGAADAGYLKLDDWKAQGHPVSFGGWR